MENEFQDLVTYTPPLYRVIRDEALLDLFRDPTLKPIIRTLREGPKTIKEILHYYNDVSDKPKSDKTMYRYVKKLEEHGLVKQSGHRVYTGRNINEILYSRTAKIFYIEFDDPDIHNEKNLMHAQMIGGLLSPLFESREVNPIKLIEFLQGFEKKKLGLVELLLTKAKPEVLDMLSQKEWMGVTYFIDAAATLGTVMEMNDLKSILESMFE